MKKIIMIKIMMKMLFNNKKGESEFDVARKVIYWGIMMVVISMVVLAFALTLGNYKSNLTKIPPSLRAELMALRFTHSADCFAIDGQDGRALPNSIDMAKFTQETLDRCYKTEESTGFTTFNFRLKLQQQGLEMMTNNYFHQDSFEMQQEVLVQKEGRQIPDQLTIYVQEKHTR